MDELKLEANGRHLKFITYDGVWCEVHYQRNNEEITLGGERLDTIITKLLISFLPEKNRKYFVYQDTEMFSVFNLMSPHSLIAGKERENFGIELIFLSNEGNLIPMFTLSIQDKKEWMSDIIKFTTSYWSESKK